MNWDVFCKVVDNFGDAGVVWRLCRQLSLEQHQRVRLIIDDISTLARLEPGVNISQLVDGVEVVHWSANVCPPADLHQSVPLMVLETFGCNPPASYLNALAAKPETAWINLEYLSAEAWVGDFHGRSSPGLDLPITRHFFFPGFDEHTGGLLREQNLLAQRDDFRRSHPRLDNALHVSLFAYPQAPVESLLKLWRQARQPVVCYLPQGIPLAARVLELIDSSDQKGSAAGSGAGGDRNALCASAWVQPTRVHRDGNLEIRFIPFTNQPGYDQLLWSCDLNLVRGEDSFVRAQWAGVPLLWQLYPQEGNAHLIKMEAFLERYCQGWEEGLRQRYVSWMRFWNGAASETPGWDQWVEDMPRLTEMSEDWARQLAGQPDLATQLVKFAAKMLK